MRKLFIIPALILMLSPSVWADFSRSQVVLHPVFPATNPFIIEISGTWPTDCHPGEQKPVVESWDGQTVEIGFEIIVVHITCNTVDTTYRVLVDMSEAVRKTAPQGDELNVLANFDGETLDETVDLVCPQGMDCENLAGEQQKPEPGLYYAPDLCITPRTWPTRDCCWQGRTPRWPFTPWSTMKTAPVNGCSPVTRWWKTASLPNSSVTAAATVSAAIPPGRSRI
jgi:hypothetical protein